VPEQTSHEGPAESGVDDGAHALLDHPADDATSEDASAATALSPRLYGQPIGAMPNDLYIPPDALEVFLDAFEGPLDLLLYLIRKQNFNILDIPMAQVTLQYLEYVEQVRKSSLEMASEYLLMAATLINIKSRMLLPQRQEDLVEEDADPRAELVRRLLEYEQIKQAAIDLGALPQLDRDFLRPELHIEQGSAPPLPHVDAHDLQRAFADVLRRAKLVQHHRIRREELSVREHMSAILRALRDSRFVEFSDLFQGQGSAPVVVVHFVAMLELAKETLIEITQAEAFAPIYVRLAGSRA
jgi:segregation and condensation protein A